MRSHAAQQALVINDHPLAAAPPGQHRAAVEALRVVGDDQRFVEDHLLPQAVADGAGAGGRVEGKMLRRQRLEALARARTETAIRVQRLCPLAGVCRIARLREQQQFPIAPLQRHLDGIGEARANLVVDDQPVHHHVDVVARLGIELHADVRLQLDQFSIHARAHETLAGQPLHHVAELALLVADDRREQHHARLRRKREDLVHDIAGCLRHDGDARLGTMWLADMRVEQAQVIINLRRGRDGRARVHAAGVLLDGDRGREALDEVHVRLLHLVEELPRVSRQALDVLPLPLRVERVEGERGFPRTAQAGDDDELVTRDRQREVLQVVLPRAADLDEIFAHDSRMVGLNYPRSLGG